MMPSVTVEIVKDVRYVDEEKSMNPIPIPGERGPDSRGAQEEGEQDDLRLRKLHAENAPPKCPRVQHRHLVGGRKASLRS